ncbi:MAG: class I SAM-dependent methyltransferase [Planctomycetota bacterium]
MSYSKDYWFTYQRQIGHMDLIQRNSHDYELALARISKIKRFVTAGKLIDVGCSNGAFVRRALEDGFISEGLELHESIAQIARSLNAVRMRVGDLREQKLPSETYDVVVLNDVIEHFYDPLNEMAEINRILKIHGLLVIETPNADMLKLSGFMLSWKHVRPSEHLFLFSEDLLTEILKDYQFNILLKEYPIPGKISIYSQKTK